MVEFAGWRMPLLYTGIVEEHLHTRGVCSLFDVSHMGRLDLIGPDAGALVDRVVTRNVAKMVVGRCAYAHVCREDGGILDDVLVYKYEDHWMIVCNGANREKIVSWLRRHADGKQVTIDDKTTRTAMIATQGPRARELFAKVIPLPVSDIKNYRFICGGYWGMDYTLSRTGYTGEDGFEIIVPDKAAMMAWQYFRADANLREQVRPAGLGARDTLRLEAGMPLYGHELSEEIDSISAGQGWCVHLDTDFVGADALRKIKEQGPRKKLVGLELSGKRIAREGSVILSGDQQVGTITSGTMSPTLERSIAMGYVSASLAEPGTGLLVVPRGKAGRGQEAKVVPLPFYKAGK